MDSSSFNLINSDVSSSDVLNCVSVSGLVDKTVKNSVVVKSVKTVNGVVLNSKLPNVGKYKSPKFVREGDIFEPKPRPSPKTCSCACGNTSGFTNDFYVKKQTCFNCGIPGHIARNCQNRAYVPYYAQGWQKVPRGRSCKRNISKSNSGNTTKNSQQDKTTTKPKDKTVTRPDLRVDSTKSHSDRSISSPKSSSLSYKKNMSKKQQWIPKSIPKSKSKTNSKSKSKTPNRSNNKSSKPNYQWIPKVAKLEEISVDSCNLTNEQSMCWEQVMKIDSNGKPSLSMDWVPVSN